MPELTSHEFSKRDLFDYASGDLDRNRRAAIAEQALRDPELAARIAFFRLFVPPTVSVRQLRIGHAVRFAAVSSSWGVCLGVIDNNITSITPFFSLKPAVLGALGAVISLTVITLAERRSSRFSLDQGTIFESIEVPILLGVPFGLAIAILATVAHLERLIPLGYVIVGLPCSLLGASRGFGLKKLRAAATEISVKAHVGRVVLYFLYIGQFYGLIAFLIWMSSNVIEDFVPVTRSLYNQVVWGSIAFGFAGAVSVGVRSAFNEQLAPRGETSVVAHALLRECLVALCIGPMLLLTLIALTGNYRPALFPLMTMLAMLWWIFGSVATVAVHGEGDPELSGARQIAAMAVRRCIKFALAILLAIVWRVFLLEEHGWDSILTMSGLFVFAAILGRLERMELPFIQVLIGQPQTRSVTRASSLEHTLAFPSWMAAQHLLALLREFADLFRRRPATVIAK